MFGKLRDMGPKSVLVVLAVFMVIFAVVAGVVVGTVEAKQATAARENNELYRMDEAKREQAELKRLDGIYEEAKELSHQAMPGFLLLGDDLTAAVGGNKTDYGLALQQMVSDYILNPFRFEDAVAPEFKRIVHTNEKRYALPVVTIARYGVAGESTATTLAMDGAYKIVLTEPVTVPAGCYNVPISFQSERGDYIYPLVGGNKRNEQVLLLDEATGTRIAGTIQPVTSSDPIEYLFVRSEAGEETTFPAGTRMVTRQSQENRELFPIVWLSGMNGGYDSIDELIEQNLALLEDKELYAEGYYLVIGRIDSTAAEETAFEAAFGDHYLNAREYLNRHGLEAAGITPTSADRAVLPTGAVPVSLRDVNNISRYPYTLNRAGYIAIGREVYRRIDALGFFDRVQGVLDNAMAEVAAGAVEE